MRRFIPVRPITPVGGGQWVVASDTVVYVNLDHVVSVTMRGKVALIKLRNKSSLVRCYRDDFMRQVERLNEPQRH
jgi:hypothetical protein